MGEVLYFCALKSTNTLCDLRLSGFYLFNAVKYAECLGSNSCLWTPFARLVMGNVIDGEEAVAIFAIAKYCIYQIISFVSFRTLNLSFRTVDMKRLGGVKIY